MSKSVRLLVGVLLLAVLVLPQPAAAATGVSATPRPMCHANGTVRALVELGGVLYLGGDFSGVRSAGSATVVPRSRLAACSVATGRLLPWSPQANDTVHDLAAAGGLVYAAGRFTAVGGASRSRVAALHPTTGAATPWNPGPSNTVLAVAVTGDTVYLGGDFHAVAQVARVRLAAVSASTGALKAWAPGADGRVRDLLLANGAVYAAGAFRSLNGVAAPYLRPLHPETGALLGWQRAAAYEVMAVDTDGQNIYAAQGGPGGRVEKFDPKGRRAWARVGDGDCQAIKVVGTAVIAGGHFTKIDGVAVPRLASMDTRNGAVDRAWVPNPNLGTGLGVWRLASDGVNLFVGGDFTRMASQTQERVALLPG